ncbi:MAG: TolC family protein [Candidatus Omnitrophota bacterium]
MKYQRCIFILVLSVCFLCCPGAFAVEEVVSDSEGLPPQKEEARPISLGECVRFAVYNSFEVKIAKLDLLIAETDKMYAESVFDALIFGDVNYTEDKRQQISVFAPDDSQTNAYSLGITKELLTGTELTAQWSDTRDWVNTPFVTRNPAHTAQLLLEARQPVGRNFFGYIDRNNLSVTKLAILNADLQMKDSIEEIIANVEKAYWNLVFRKRSLDIRRDILEKARKLNESNAKNYDIGLIELADYFASQANVRIRETDYSIAENAYRRAEENLKLIMNMDDSIRLFPGEAFSRESVGYDLVDCLKVAFEKRRDYMMDKRDVEIKNITLKMKDNEKWPEIDLVGSMAMNGVDTKFAKAFGKTTVADNTYYYAGIEFSVPVENNLARGEYKKAAYEKEEAILTLKETERTIITEVGNSFRDVVTYNTNVANMVEAVSLQAKKLKEEEKRFKYGRSKTKTLIDYQQDLLLTETGEALVLLDRETSRVGLERDMNVILDKYERLL